MSADQPTRAEILDALQALLVRAWNWRTVGRREVLFSELPAQDRPALFILKAPESYSYQSENLQDRTLGYWLAVYIDSSPGGPNDPPVDLINSLMDAIDAALRPQGADLPGNKQTLGGRVSHCYIAGEVAVIRGDLDNDGLIVVPVSILLP